MKVSLNSSNVYSSSVYNFYNGTQTQPASNPAFGSAKARKLIEKVLQADSNNFRGIKATFDDMVAAYNELGYDVIMKRGSHAAVPITDHANLPLVIPHNNKYVHPLDLKRLKYVIQGETEKALNVH